MIIEAATMGDSEALLRSAAERLRKARIDSPRREARLLLAFALGIGHGDLATRRIFVEQSAAETFASYVERRVNREPLAYILETREFWSLDFAVAPGVLIPRPETEILVDAALRKFSDRDAALRALDLGTGSGCLLLSLLSERPHATGVGIDRSETALAMAARNARSLCLHDRAEFRLGDWTAGVAERYHVVLTNPPYISTGDLAYLAADIGYEPREALEGGPDGLNAYRRIAEELVAVLAPGGMAFVEIGLGQAGPVEQLFAAAKLNLDGTVCDLAGIPRCIMLRADQMRGP